MSQPLAWSRLDLVSLFREVPDPPLEVAALSLARDFEPCFDPSDTLDTLDTFGEELKRRVSGAVTPRDLAGAVGTYLYDHLEFQGDEESYYDPRNSLLHQVVARRRGIPISLAVLVLAVARRAGVSAEGIGFPGHFLVRLGGVSGVYIDPFFGGRVMDTPQLEQLARRMIGNETTLSPEHLQPVGARLTVVRMLRNLQRIHEQLGDHARGMLIADRLADLAGGVDFVRDRGLHALALGAHAVAAEDLRRYLEARPSARDADAVRAALERARTAHATQQLQ